MSVKSKFSPLTIYALTARLICGYCEEEMLIIFFAQCLNLPLIGLGYIKAAIVKTTTKAKASLKSLI